MTGTVFDRRLAARAVGVAVIALAVTALVIASTDEGAAWKVRLGMLAALAPVAGTLGALAAIRVAAARGELRALAAIGVDPWRGTLGAVVGGAGVGLLGPLGAALGLGDFSALFPRPAATRRWIVDGDGLRELTLGIRVGARGLLSLETPLPSGAVGLPSSAPAFTLGMLAAAAIVCPLWAAAGGSGWRRAAVGTAAVGMAVGAFQAVAAGRLPAAALLAAPLILLIDTAAARHGARYRTARVSKRASERN